MIGKIEEARRSQSGKSLGLKIANKWYQTKNWDMEHMVGQEIEFTPDTNSYQGKTYYWINDWVPAQHDPVVDAMLAREQAVPPTAPSMQPTDSNKPSPEIINFVGRCVAASVVAGHSIEAIEADLPHFYNMALGTLSGRLAALATTTAMQEERAAAEPREQGSDFDDDIPF